MAEQKPHVMITGTKDGLAFILDDQCEFEQLIEELTYKLEKTHHHFLSGPIVHVQIKLGERTLTDEQEIKMRSVIGQRGNLLIRAIESNHTQHSEPEGPDETIEVMRGMVRSGQTLHCDKNVLFLGDVNPGGTITSKGDIYIMGSLRGIAHAGVEGNEEAIITASYLKPTQLRISEVISRPPDEWDVDETYMEFAYLKDGNMQIDKINYLHRIRPNAMKV